MPICILTEDHASLNEDLGMQQQPSQLSWSEKEDWILGCNWKSPEDLNEASSVVAPLRRFLTSVESDRTWGTDWQFESAKCQYLPARLILICFALRQAVCKNQGCRKSEMHRITWEWPGTFNCQKYPVNTEYLPARPKFSPVRPTRSRF